MKPAEWAARQERALAAFKEAWLAGRATRADWPLWCWRCDAPVYAAHGTPPLSECDRCCYEEGAA